MNALDRFDSAADHALERLRGRRTDRLFLAASELGDFSLIWHIVGVARGLTSEQHATQAFLFSALIGLESLVVNQGIKRLFRRQRPTEAGDPRYPALRVFDVAAFAAQDRIRVMNGTRNTWFCGAWMRNGFHEDGFASAVDVVEALAERHSLPLAA